VLVLYNEPMYRPISRGFTIVELLVVIVIIAILAAVSIATYNGAQVRAENTKTLAGIDQVGKTLALYKTVNGKYPLVNYTAPITEYNGVYTCLSDASTQCGRVSGATGAPCDYVGGPVNGSADIDSALKTVVSTLPQISSKDLTCEGKTVRGIYYYANRPDLAPTVLYFLKGNQKCGIPTNSYISYSPYYSDGDVTACYIRFNS
jgi:prepilin-type N-terminal cleavage/methylation domain-containing protein